MRKYIYLRKNQGILLDVDQETTNLGKPKWINFNYLGKEIFYINNFQAKEIIDFLSNCFGFKEMKGECPYCQVKFESMIEIEENNNIEKEVKKC